MNQSNDQSKQINDKNHIQYTLKEEGSLSYSCSIQAENSYVMGIVAEYAKAVSHNSKVKNLISGFRPGHVPISFMTDVLLSHFFQDFNQYILKTVSTEALQEITQKVEKSIFDFQITKPANLQEVCKSSADLIYEVNIDFMPNIEIPNLAKLKLEAFDVKLTTEDVDKAFKEWCSVNKKIVKVENRASAMQDILEIDLTVTRKQGEVESKRIRIQLGAGQMQSEIEQKLVDKNIEDVVEHELIIPRNVTGLPQGAERYAGDTMHMKIKILGIFEKKDYEDNDKDLLVAWNCSSIEECKNKFKEVLKRQIDISEYNCRKTQLIEIFGSVSMELPASIMKKSIRKGLLNVYKRYEIEVSNDIDILNPDDSVKKAICEKIDEVNSFEDIMYHVRSVNERELKSWFIVNFLKESWNIKVVEAEIEMEIENRKNRFVLGLEEAKEHYKVGSKARQDLKEIIAEEKTLSEALSRITKVTKEVSYDEFQEILQKYSDKSSKIHTKDDEMSKQSSVNDEIDVKKSEKNKEKNKENDIQDKTDQNLNKKINNKDSKKHSKNLDISDTIKGNETKKTKSTDNAVLNDTANNNNFNGEE